MTDTKPVAWMIECPDECVVEPTFEEVWPPKNPDGYMCNFCDASVEDFVATPLYPASAMVERLAAWLYPWDWEDIDDGVRSVYRAHARQILGLEGTDE